MQINKKRFSGIFDPRRSQTQHFSDADKEDCFFVMVAEIIGEDQDYKDMCKRIYRTYRKGAIQLN